MGLTGNHACFPFFKSSPSRAFTLQEVRAMKMDVTELTFDQLEELIARLERVSTGAVIQRNGTRLELKVG